MGYFIRRKKFRPDLIRPAFPPDLFRSAGIIAGEDNGPLHPQRFQLFQCRFSVGPQGVGHCQITENNTIFRQINIGMGQRSRIDFIFCQQTVSATQILIPADLIGDTHTGKLLVFRDRRGVYRPVAGYHCLCHGMGGKALPHGAETEQFICGQGFIQRDNAGDG